MTKKTGKDNLLFSYSKLNLYTECPQKYKFRYIDKIPEKPKSYFAFGKSIHGALEFLYNVKAPPFPSLQEVLAEFKKDWDSSSPESKGYDSHEKAASDFQEGLKILKAYYAKHGATLQVPVSVEYKATVTIDELPVIIIVDRIDDLGGGKVAIVDYKTGKTVRKEPDQLYMYQKVLESPNANIKSVIEAKTNADVREVVVEKLIFYQLAQMQEHSFERASASEISKFWKRVLLVADDIRAQKFEPLPEEGKCRWCDYKNLCPIFAKTGAKGVKSVEKEELLVTNESDILSMKVDRYGELLRRHSETAAELERVKNEIVALMRDKGFVRHFGSKYQVNLEKLAKWQFADRDKLVGAIKELGYLQKILVPTKTTVEKLLEDESLPVQDRDKLRAFARKAEYFELACSELKD